MKASLFNLFSLHQHSHPSTRLRLALAALMTLQMTTPCQAGLFSWLFGPRKTQTVVCCQPAACNTCTAQRTVVNYAPETVYTTSWVRVPVTTYRPVTTTDPTTCSQVRYMQPATSYVWQARRQPHVIYKPFLSRIANACAAGPYAVPPGVAAPVAAPVATPGTAGPLVTTPSTMPPAGAVAPGTAPIGSSVSPYPVSPYSSGATPGAAAPPAGVEPADLAPRLNTAPQVNQRPLLDAPYPYGNATGSTYPNTTYPPTGTTYPPTGTTTYPPTGATTYPPTGATTYPPTGSTTYPPTGTTTYPPAAGYSSPTPAPSTQTNRVPVESNPYGNNGNGANNNGSSNSNGNTNGQSNSNNGAPVMTPPKKEPSQGLPPNPVPDPDADNSTRSTPQWKPPVIRTPNVPRLLNPTDRTASLQPRIAAPVRWATVQPAVYRAAPSRRAARNSAPAPVDLRQPRHVRPALNDGGWRPVGS